MPNALRQLSTFGNLFSSEVGGGQLIQTHDPRLIIVGFLETALYNFSGHYIYQAPLFLEGFVYGLADLLGVDAMDSSIIDPHDAFALNEPFEYSHDIAGNPVLAILGAAALVVFIWILKKRQRDKSDAYVAFAYISISIFMLLLRHGHEGPLALLPFKKAFRSELGKGPTHSNSAHLVFLLQLMLRWYP